MFPRLLDCFLFCHTQFLFDPFVSLRVSETVSPISSLLHLLSNNYTTNYSSTSILQYSSHNIVVLCVFLYFEENPITATRHLDNPCGPGFRSRRPRNSRECGTHGKAPSVFGGRVRPRGSIRRIDPGTTGAVISWVP